MTDGMYDVETAVTTTVLDCAQRLAPDTAESTSARPVHGRDGTDEGDEGDEGDPDDPPEDDPPDDEPPDDPPLAAMGTTITTMSRLIPTAPPAASYHVGRASSFATHSGRELLAAFASVRA